MDEIIKSSLILITIFAILALICLIGWITCYISTKALLLYIKAKKYDTPNKEEIKKWTKRAAKHTLGIQIEDIE